MHIRAGDWKLAGLEYVCAADTQPPAKILPCLEKYVAPVRSSHFHYCSTFNLIRYDPPERKDQSKARLATAWAADIWGLGCLIWEVGRFSIFNIR